MLLTLPDVLSAEQVAQVLARLEAAEWVDGRVTAGVQSAQAKRNLQVPEDSAVARELGATVLAALRANPAFVSAALPLKVFPPLFNRYDTGMGFGDHVDNAIRFSDAARFRIDVSVTLFLSDPQSYDGGELVIRGAEGERAVKLPAGSLVLYPATTIHSVRPITRGSRWASFFWAQSMVRSAEKRNLLYEMDQSIQALAARFAPGDPDLVSLTGGYHNLVRMWAEV